MTWDDGGSNTTKYNLKATVTGTGTLTAFHKGDLFAEVTSADGVCKLEFTSSSALTGLSFVYEPGVNDSGYAELSDFRHGYGTVLVFR